MDDEQIREAAIGAVDAVAYSATEEEIAAAIAEIGAERGSEDGTMDGEGGDQVDA